MSDLQKQQPEDTTTTAFERAISDEDQEALKRGVVERVKAFPGILSYVATMVGVLFCGLAGVAEVNTTWWSVTAILSGLAVLMMLSGGLVLAAPDSFRQAAYLPVMKPDGHLVEQRQRVLQVWPVLLVLLVVPLSFAILSHALYHSTGGFAGVPATGDIALLKSNYSIPSMLFPSSSGRPQSAWAAYAVSWLIDTLTFNGSQIGRWINSPIRPTAWWSAVLLWLYCIACDVIVLAAVLNLLTGIIAGVRRTMRIASRR